MLESLQQRSLAALTNSEVKCPYSPLTISKTVRKKVDSIVTKLRNRKVVKKKNWLKNSSILPHIITRKKFLNTVTFILIHRKFQHTKMNCNLFLYLATQTNFCTYLRVSTYLLFIINEFKFLSRIGTFQLHISINSKQVVLMLCFHILLHGSKFENSTRC